MRILLALIKGAWALGIVFSVGIGPGVQAQSALPPVSEDFLLSASPYHLRLRGASARPAAKTYFLLYAADLDRYAEKNQVFLKNQPSLQKLIVEEKARALSTFETTK